MAFVPFVFICLGLFWAHLQLGRWGPIGSWASWPLGHRAVLRDIKMSHPLFQTPLLRHVA